MNRIVALLAVIIIAIVVIILFTNLTSLQDNDSIIEGKFFDESGNQLGTCTSETEDFVTRTYFYRLDGTLIGSCSSYSGPGGSGSKGGCTSDELLTEPCEGTGCGQLLGQKVQKYYCQFE